VRYEHFRRFACGFYDSAFRDLFFSRTRRWGIYEAVLSVLAGNWKPSPDPASIAGFLLLTVRPAKVHDRPVCTASPGQGVEMVDKATSAARSTADRQHPSPRRHRCRFDRRRPAAVRRWLGLDSVDALELMVAIEKEYGIKIERTTSIARVSICHHARDDGGKPARASAATSN
jgi:hypothetical protein